MKYLIIPFVLLFVTSCNSQAKDCSNFRKGTFKYSDKNLDYITITRNDSIQIEYNSKDDITITTNVEWTSPCKYILTYQDVSNYEYRNDIIGKKIYVEILETDGNTYTSQVSSSTTESKTTLVKVKE